MHESLRLLEALRAVLDVEPVLDAADLAARVGVSADSAVFQAALRRLDDRLEILVDPLTHAVRGRRKLTADVVDALADAGPSTQASLRARLKVETAPLAEVLGWLQREKRVEFVVVDGVEKARLRRGSSGPHAVVDPPAT
jgi:hypothetical protein